MGTVELSAVPFFVVKTNSKEILLVFKEVIFEK
jgi:hypothetical protein